jgi:hypothetical protein
MSRDAQEGQKTHPDKQLVEFSRHSAASLFQVAQCLRNLKTSFYAALLHLTFLNGTPFPKAPARAVSRSAPAFDGFNGGGAMTEMSRLFVQQRSYRPRSVHLSGLRASDMRP